jgi:hypothetical protein
MNLLDSIQLALTAFNALAFIFTMCGWYRTGFVVGIIAQPGWYYLGHVTGTWANMALAVFYTFGSIFGILRENHEKHVRYGDFTEAVLWFFKIGWEPCDNHGAWYNKRRRATQFTNK